MKLAELVLSSSWPPCRDKMRYNADWLIYTQDMWRVAMCGIPSIFD